MIGIFFLTFAIIPAVVWLLGKIAALAAPPPRRPEALEPEAPVEPEAPARLWSRER